MPMVITQMVTGSSVVVGAFGGELLVPGDTLGSLVLILDGLELCRIGRGLVLENAKHSDPTLLSFSDSLSSKLSANLQFLHSSSMASTYKALKFVFLVTTGHA